MLRVINLKKGVGPEELYQSLSERNRLEYPEVLDAVGAIIKRVREGGDHAVIDYTREFDKVELDPSQLKVSGREMEEAFGLVDQEILSVIEKAAKNIAEFHKKQKEKSWFTAEEEGIFLGQLCRPLETAGVYVPGGTAPLISSVLMNIIPAKVAGVEKVIMCTPPAADGTVDPAVLAAAIRAGADEIYRIGGAQAVAAMAFGTETVPKVDKICGPGNIYVSTAKRMVFGYCDIDMFAGPSEIVVAADETANPAFVAADLLSQAEHDPLAASVLVTSSETLAEKVREEILKQYSYLGRKDIIRKSLSRYGAIIIAEDTGQVMDIVNRLAPEHLEICMKDPFSLLGRIKNAGAVFLGHYSPEPLGDYFAGPNHVLPTGGTARFFSPLGVSDFVRKSSIISYTREALERVKDDVRKFAEAERLDAHANAVRVRFEVPGLKGQL